MKIIPKFALVVMIGPSGAGKSTFAQKTFNAAEIISSDAIRQEICGNFRDLSKDKHVFRTLKLRASFRLTDRKRVVLDATHLTDKARTLPIELAKASNAPLYYVIVNRPMKEKQRDGGWRLEIPFLMPKHEKTFQENEKQILSGDNGLATVIDARIEAFEVE